MAILRSHAILKANPDAVWQVIRDVPGISSWFPAIIESSGNQTHRKVVLEGGIVIEEDIVTLDDEVRRLQYRGAGGDLPIESHLGTIDVIEIDSLTTLLVYTTEVKPDDLAAAYGPAVEGGVEALREKFK